MPSSNHSGPDRLVLIGASTGGPGHLRQIVQLLDKNFSATLIIAQHMEDQFIPSFVKQLQQLSDYRITAVNDCDQLLPGTVYVCSMMTRLGYDSDQLKFSRKPTCPIRFNPDIDYLFKSAAEVAHRVPVLGVILTGVGDDGARGCRALVRAGGTCIAECESTAIVNGMPMQAQRLAPEISVQKLSEISHSINRFGC